MGGEISGGGSTRCQHNKCGDPNWGTLIYGFTNVLPAFFNDLSAFRLQTDRFRGCSLKQAEESGKQGETMGSRDKDSTTNHQPLLSSLVVRPSNSDGGGGGVGATSGARVGRGSDYEAGEVPRDPPQYSRLDRYSADLALCCRLQELRS
ncbi:hypothetical protein SDJN03_16537, partial [Cucurbita argyrosperma subsp. sororia]